MRTESLLIPMQSERTLTESVFSSLNASLYITWVEVQEFGFLSEYVATQSL